MAGAADRAIHIVDGMVAGRRVREFLTDMNRLKLYWNYATRSLRRGGQRTLLAIFCIAVGVMAIVSLQLVGNMVNTALTGNVRAGNGGDISVRNDITPFNEEQLATFASLKADGTLTQYTAVVNEQVHARGQRAASVVPAVCGGSGGLPPGGISSLQRPQQWITFLRIAGQYGSRDRLSALPAGPAEGRYADHPFADRRSLALRRRLAESLTTSGFFDQPEMLVSLDTYKALPSTEGLPPQYNAVYANVPGHTDANQDKAKAAIYRRRCRPRPSRLPRMRLQQNKAAVQNLRYFLEIVGAAGAAHRRCRHRQHHAGPAAPAPD